MLDNEVWKFSTWLSQTGGRLKRLGRYSHVKIYGDVAPKWVSFSPKIHRQGSHFRQKSLKEGPSLRKLRKKVKNHPFLRLKKKRKKKLLKMGPDFRKFRCSGQISRFLREKNIWTPNPYYITDRFCFLERYYPFERIRSNGLKIRSNEFKIIRSNGLVVCSNGLITVYVRKRYNQASK